MILTLSDISKSFGQRVLFKDVNLRILAGDRIALIGPNGAGKTTLMEIITGAAGADDGRVILGKGVKIGHLEQEAIEMSGRSVIDEVMSATSSLKDLEARIQMLETQMAELSSDPSNQEGSAEQKELLAQYARTVERFEAKGGWDIDHQARALLGGLGFKPEDADRDVGEFSGDGKCVLRLRNCFCVSLTCCY